MAQKTGLGGPNRVGFDVGFKAALNSLFPIDDHWYMARRRPDGTIEIIDPMKPVELGEGAVMRTIRP